MNVLRVVAGGLSAEQLADADEDDVIGWSVAGVQHIHPDVLKVYTL